MDAATEPRSAPLAPSRRDWVIAAALALATGVLYALTFQTRWFGDGPGLASMHVLGSVEQYYHLLYLPACDFVARMLGHADPFQALRLVSIVPAALGAGFTFLVARACGATVVGASIALALLVLAPSLWFFGTTVEIHALHFGCVALVAAVTLLAPWRRPALALALSALAFPLLYWSHQAAFTLGPGWVLLVQYARARHGTRYTPRALLLGVGPVLLAALFAAVVVSYLVRFGSLALAWADVREQLVLRGGQSNIGPHAATWRDEWLLPLGVLVPLAAFGCARLRHERLLFATLLVLLLVPAGFFLWWGVAERGGYFLGSAPFLALPVARLFERPRPRGLALALVLVAAQGTYGRARIRAHDTGFDPERRVELVRAALGGEGLLLTSVEHAPDIRCWLPDMKEFSLKGMILNACERERRMLTPQELLEHAQRILPGLFKRNPRVALDLGYTRTPADAWIPEFRGGLEAIERDLRAHWEVREIEDPYWPLLVLERPR